MENRKLVTLSLAIFALTCLPFLILYSSGEANSGLGQGFQATLAPNTQIFLTFLVGALAVWVGRDAPIILPLTYILVYAGSALDRLDHDAYPYAPGFMLGALLIYTVSLTLVDTRRFVVAIAIATSIGMQLGFRNQAMSDQVIDPLYFLLGQFLALVLVLATAVCFSTALYEKFSAIYYWLVPPESEFSATLRSWFL